MSTDKFNRLIDILQDMESALLAYSGGVDSTLLLKAMQLSGIKVLAVTASSEIRPRRDTLSALQTAKEMEISCRIIETKELLLEPFAGNSPERCFFCKDELFKILQPIALAEGCRFILEGSNASDSLDYRPGLKAAAKYHARSPLLEAGLSKTEIRELSKQFGLSTWDRPSSPCLATRFPYGQRLTTEALRRVESAEEFLRSLGFNEIRVRDHNGVARIEIGEDRIETVLGEKRKIISETLKSIGYTFVSLDLEGYQSGSMDRLLADDSGSWKPRNI